MNAGLVTLPEAESAYLWTVLLEHVLCKPCLHREGRDALIELANAGELEVPAPWAVRPDLGRWP